MASTRALMERAREIVSDKWTPTWRGSPISNGLCALMALDVAMNELWETGPLDSDPILYASRLSTRRSIIDKLWEQLPAGVRDRTVGHRTAVIDWNDQQTEKGPVIALYQRALAAVDEEV